MAYMVLKHTKPEFERAGLWFVADMDHPEHLPRIIQKPLDEALDYCARMNRGERFWDCQGKESLHEGLLRFLEKADETPMDRWGTAHFDAVRHFRGQETHDRAKETVSTHYHERMRTIAAYCTRNPPERLSYVQRMALDYCGGASMRAIQV